MTTLQLAADRIDAIPEFKPRVNYMSWADAPIHACNASVLPPRESPVKSSPAKRPGTPGAVAPTGSNSPKPSEPPVVATARKGRNIEKKPRGARLRSASAGRDGKSELASRYWAYLFENLERSISEIYDTCEKQDNVLQCKEVILILENYTRDFKNLIEWVNLKWQYDQTPQRPNALAWEIRKPSFTALPHTRAYEQLVDLNFSPKPKTPPHVSPVCDEAPHVVVPAAPDPEPAPSPVLAAPDPVPPSPAPVILSPAPVILSPAPVILSPVPVVPSPATALSSPAPALSSPAPALPSPSLPTLENVEVDPVPDIVTTDVGLQTDIEEDPDVYYFAGGRNVGCQPEYDKEYGALEPFPPGPTPTLVVMITSETDLAAETETADEAKMRPLTPKLGTPLEPIETKSSATQLSMGGLAEEAEESKTGKAKESTSMEVSTCSSKVSLASAPTTFAEKAKRGMLRPGQGQSLLLQGKPFLVGLNRPKTTNTAPATVSVPVTSASFARGTKVSTSVNYRSNIASRCRTALNKGAPLTLVQPPVQQGSLIPASPTGLPKLFTPSTSSSAATHVKLLPTASHSLANTNNNSPSSSPRLTRRNPISSLSNSAPKSLSSSITSSSALPGPKPKPDVGSSKYTKPATLTKQQEPEWTQQGKPELSQNPRLGVFRSKSMINPVSVANAKAKDAAKNSVAARKKGNPSGSFASIPPQVGDGMKRRALSNVGEDGWETVRARNRSKWSLSSCSSSTNDLVSPQPVPEPKVIEKEIKANVPGKLSSSWKDDESSVDDEEIKQNDAALDSAIREEEMLEEELLQVEKDFEAIEKQSRGPTGDGPSETPPSEPDNSTTSPDILEISDDLENKPITEEVSSIEAEIRVKNEAKERFFIGVLEEPRAEGFPPREPGRIVTLREKLMSPAKRCDGAETLRRHQAKLAKAERNRERLLESKYNHYVELSDRFEALNETTKRLVERRATLVTRAEERRRRAVEKRQEYLKNIRMKAHDEDSKAKEIAFINYLEAQNKRHDYLASAQEVEERLLCRDEERKTKLDERGTKAAGVLERQFRIRNNWQLKLGQMQERRRKAQERIMREKQERAKERTDLAQEKARDREGRVTAMNAAKQARKEELKKVIQQKQQDTARRHEENMEHIRQRAFELSVPRTSEDAAVRMCTLCKIMIQSEVQELVHLRGRAHMEAVKKIEKNSINSGTIHISENFGLKFIADVQLDKVEPGLQTDKNRFKTMKKHCKKIILKLSETGKEFESVVIPTEINGKHYGDQKKLKNKIQRNIREIERLINLFESEKGSIHLATSLDRLLSETRKAAVRNLFIQESLVELGLFKVIQNLFHCKAADLPSKVFVGACNLLIGATFQNLTNTLYIMRSSCICNILEFAASRWNALVPDDNRWLCGSPVGANEPLPVDPVVESVIELLFNVLNVVPDPFIGIRSPKQNVVNGEEIKLIELRALDILGYIVCSGIVDRLSVYCTGVRGPVDSQPQVAGLLKASLDFLTMLIYALQTCWDQKKADSTQLLAALESSEIAGAISMTYSLLLYQGAPTRPRSVENGNCVPPPPGPLSASLVKSTLCLINAIAMLDSCIFQDVLGSEAVSLQFRHITSQLLWQVVPHSEKEPQWSSLISQLLIAVGNFTVQNKQNQVTIQSGQTPTVLQQLCSLPSPYFNEPKLSRHLFPTLIAATYGCPENQNILTQQNISAELLDGFMKSEYAKVNSITKRLISSRTPNSDSNPTTTPTSPATLSPSKKAKKSQAKKIKAAVP